MANISKFLWNFIFLAIYRNITLTSLIVQIKYQKTTRLLNIYSFIIITIKWVIIKLIK